MVRVFVCVWYISLIDFNTLVTLCIDQFNPTVFTVVWTEIRCEALERSAADAGGIWRHPETLTSWDS